MIFISVFEVQKYGNFRQNRKIFYLITLLFKPFRTILNKITLDFLINNPYQELYLLIYMLNFNLQSIVSQENILRKTLFNFMMKANKMT
jgi:hypothetical protein